jgi:hypothetical protein
VFGPVSSTVVVVYRGTVKFPTISLKTGFLLAFISDNDSKPSWLRSSTFSA